MPADARRNLEDIYELAPLQEGMLFHHLSAPGSGLYCEQMSFEIEGDLDEAAFARAWQVVIDRHPALRTSFQWEGLEKPLQVVHRSVSLPIEQQDWTADGGATPERLERFGASERKRASTWARRHSCGSPSSGPGPGAGTLSGRTAISCWMDGACRCSCGN